MFQSSTGNDTVYRTQKGTSNAPNESQRQEVPVRRSERIAHDPLADATLVPQAPVTAHPSITTADVLRD